MKTFIAGQWDGRNRRDVLSLYLKLETQEWDGQTRYTVKLVDETGGPVNRGNILALILSRDDGKLFLRRMGAVREDVVRVDHDTYIAIDEGTDEDHK